jgi:hypothetical protein
MRPEHNRYPKSTDHKMNITEPIKIYEASTDMRNRYPKSTDHKMNITEPIKIYEALT